MKGGVQAEFGAISASPPAARRHLRAERLVRGHADFIYRCLARFGVSDADLQDLAQECFLVALRKDEDWTDPRCRPWLFGVARKVASAHRRRAYRRREQSSDTLDHEPDPHANPEELAAQREARRRLAAILDTMNVELRATFVMFEIEGMSGREIAELSGIPVQTVFSRLRRARRIFERAAKEEAP